MMRTHRTLNISLLYDNKRRVGLLHVLTTKIHHNFVTKCTFFKKNLMPMHKKCGGHSPPHFLCIHVSMDR